MHIRYSNLFVIPALAAAAALAGGTAHAAETVTVPFEFTAQGHSFPSGSYAVEQDHGKHVVTLHKVKGDATLNWTMSPCEYDRGHIHMNFDRAADGTHILKSIQFSRFFTLEGDAFQNLPGRLVPIVN
jgi:hypothetical protein